MDVDTDTLHRIREYRVVADPLVPHPRRAAWLETTPDNFKEFVIEARRDRLADAPTDAPIKKATWPEATVFCFTRSMDAAIDQAQHLGAYKYCFSKTADDHLSNSFEALTPDSFEVNVTERHRELAESFREYIAKAQHAAFIEEHYDDLPFDVDGVPKAFWRGTLPAGTTSDDTDTTATGRDAQIQLSDY